MSVTDCPYTVGLGVEARAIAGRVNTVTEVEDVPVFPALSVAVSTAVYSPSGTTCPLPSLPSHTAETAAPDPLSVRTGVPVVAEPL